ncbi:MAG: OsmC family protein [Chitinophagaceae bacterium]|nr:OsmC family protein [Chitinophagaceae bacterium]
MSTHVKKSIESLIQQIKNNPNEAKAVFEATSVLGKQVHVKSTARQFEFHFDEPELLGGKDADPNPVEYVLGALGACQAIVYRALASLKGIQLENVTVKTKGHLDLQGFLGLDSKVRPGFNKVEFETEIVSPEEPQTLERLAQQAEALCPVLDILSNPIEVSGKVVIKQLEEAN